MDNEIAKLPYNEKTELIMQVNITIFYLLVGQRV